MEPQFPTTLEESMATEPAWLQAWLLTLILTHFVAILFIVGREKGQWSFRLPPVAIIASFIAAGALMGVLYEIYGYVRLLGLAHLIFWTPAYVWILMIARNARGNVDAVNGTMTIDLRTFYGKYILFYLAVAGTSLFIDAIDLVRYFLGDGELLYRWNN